MLPRVENKAVRAAKDDAFVLLGNVGDCEGIVRRVSLGQDVNATHQKLGMTCLHAAVNAGKLDTAITLLDLRADVNCLRKGTGDTPLHLCVTSANVSEALLKRFVRLLLSRGASPDIMNSRYQRPLESAIEYRKLPAVKLLSKLPTATTGVVAHSIGFSRAAMHWDSNLLDVPHAYEYDVGYRLVPQASGTSVGNGTAARARASVVTHVDGSSAMVTVAGAHDPAGGAQAAVQTPDADFERIVCAKVNEVVLDGLLPNRTYEVQVRARSLVGTGPWSVPAVVRTKTWVPDACTAIRVTHTKAGQATVEWDDGELHLLPPLRYSVLYAVCRPATVQRSHDTVTLASPESSALSLPFVDSFVGSASRAETPSATAPSSRLPSPSASVTSPPGSPLRSPGASLSAMAAAAQLTSSTTISVWADPNVSVRVQTVAEFEDQKRVGVAAMEDDIAQYNAAVERVFWQSEVMTEQEQGALIVPFEPWFWVRPQGATMPSSTTVAVKSKDSLVPLSPSRSRLRDGDGGDGGDSPRSATSRSTGSRASRRHTVVATSNQSDPVGGDDGGGGGDTDAAAVIVRPSHDHDAAGGGGVASPSVDRSRLSSPIGRRPLTGARRVHEPAWPNHRPAGSRFGAWQLLEAQSEQRRLTLRQLPPGAVVRVRIVTQTAAGWGYASPFLLQFEVPPVLVPVEVASSHVVLTPNTAMVLSPDTAVGMDGDFDGDSIDAGGGLRVDRRAGSQSTTGGVTVSLMPFETDADTQVQLQAYEPDVMHGLYVPRRLRSKFRHVDRCVALQPPPIGVGDGEGCEWVDATVVRDPLSASESLRVVDLLPAVRYRFRFRRRVVAVDESTASDDHDGDDGDGDSDPHSTRRALQRLQLGGLSLPGPLSVPGSYSWPPWEESFVTCWVRTEEAAPDAPADLRVTATSTTTFRLSFLPQRSNGSPITDYIIQRSLVHVAAPNDHARFLAAVNTLPDAFDSGSLADDDGDTMSDAGGVGAGLLGSVASLDTASVAGGGDGVRRRAGSVMSVRGSVMSARGSVMGVRGPGGRMLNSSNDDDGDDAAPEVIQQDPRVPVTWLDCEHVKRVSQWSLPARLRGWKTDAAPLLSPGAATDTAAPLMECDFGRRETWDLQRLTVGAAYRFRVVAVSHTGTSQPCMPSQPMRPIPEPPGKPSRPMVDVIDSTTLLVKWELPVNTAPIAAPLNGCRLTRKRVRASGHGDESDSDSDDDVLHAAAANELVGRLTVTRDAVTVQGAAVDDAHRGNKVAAAGLDCEQWGEHVPLPRGFGWDPHHAAAASAGRVLAAMRPADSATRRTRDDDVHVRSCRVVVSDDGVRFETVLAGFFPGSAHRFRVQFRNRMGWGHTSDASNRGLLPAVLPMQPSQPFVVVPPANAGGRVGVLCWRLPHHSGATITTFLVRALALPDGFDGTTAGGPVSVAGLQEVMSVTVAAITASDFADTDVRPALRSATLVAAASRAVDFAAVDADSIAGTSVAPRDGTRAGSIADLAADAARSHAAREVLAWSRSGPLADASACQFTLPVELAGRPLVYTVTAQNSVGSGTASYPSDAVQLPNAAALSPQLPPSQ